MGRGGRAAGAVVFLRRVARRLDRAAAFVVVRAGVAVAAAIVGGGTPGSVWAAGPTIVDPGQGAFGLASGSSGAAELSGITYLGGSAYLAVGDNGAKALWQVTVTLDPVTGRITTAAVSGSVPAPGLGGDSEGIAYRATTGSVFVADEVASTIGQFDVVGGGTLAPVTVPAIYAPANVQGNFGLEALAWGAGGLWTANEEALLPDGPLSSTTAGSWVRIQRFGAGLSADGQWAYRTDPISALSSLTTAERSGVVDVLPWTATTLLVLEREFGGALPAFRSRLYGVDIGSGSDVAAVASLSGGGFTPLTKTLLWERSFSALAPSNFEGMTFGPTLGDGRQSLLLVSDNGGGTRQDLYALVVVPEPATVVLVVAALAVGAGWRGLAGRRRGAREAGNRTRGGGAA